MMCDHIVFLRPSSSSRYHFSVGLMYESVDGGGWVVSTATCRRWACLRLWRSRARTTATDTTGSRGGGALSPRPCVIPCVRWDSRMTMAFFILGLYFCVFVRHLVQFIQLNRPMWLGNPRTTGLSSLRVFVRRRTDSRALACSYRGPMMMVAVVRRQRPLRALRSTMAH